MKHLKKNNSNYVKELFGRINALEVENNTLKLENKNLKEKTDTNNYNDFKSKINDFYKCLEEIETLKDCCTQELDTARKLKSKYSKGMKKLLKSKK